MYYSYSLWFIKCALLLIFSFGLSNTVLAQMPDIEAIKSGDNHYWGDYCSSNQNESESIAIDQLLSKIAVNVESSYTNKVSESITDNQAKYKEEVEGIVKTYSAAQLRNLRTFKEPRECGIYVFRYIEKEAVNEIFDDRKSLVKNIFDKAVEFEKDRNYANALKYYYYSIVLLNSIPESSLEYNGVNLYTEPGFRIPQIMQSVRFEVINDEMITNKEREITIAVVNMEGDKVKTLDFSFWDGNDLVSAKSIDGTATINLFGASTQFSDLDLNIKYDYYENKDEIKEVGDLWELVQRPRFNYSKKLRLGEPTTPEEKAEQEKIKEEVQLEPVDDSFTLNTFMGEFENTQATDTDNEAGEDSSNQIGPEAGGDLAEAEEMDNMETHSEENASSNAVSPEELQEIVPDHLTGLKGYFNEEKKVDNWESDEFLSNKLANIENFNNLTVSNNTSKSDINKTMEGWEFRQLTSTARYPSVKMQSKEYLVPDFDSTGTLTDVNFGIMDGMYEEFRRASKFGKDWDKRQMMIKFVEKYRTAYMTRNVEQLGTMFAEQAVIITGRVLRVDEKANNNFAYEQNQEQQPDVEYLRETKNEFLERQERLFNTKPDIHLGFSTFNIIRKNNQEGIYGISMRQAYTSTNYSDEGYLFLLIDFNDEEPKIYVRAWQPKEWSDEALVELGNFNVNY